MTHPIRLARAYDPEERPGEARVLVDRLWPRGVKKTDLRLDLWPKDLTPSAGLRRWLHADRRRRWPDFIDRYQAELDKADAGEVLALLRKGPVVLLTAVHDPEDSHAAVLRDWLEERLE